MDLLCWVVTEGMAGTENQCLGVAEALDTTPIVKRIALRQPWKSLSPWLGSETDKIFLPIGDKLLPPWPDVALVAGRKAIAAARYIKKESRGKTLVVFLQDPRISSSQFDLIAVPEHDRLRGPNVIVTAAAANRITPERLEYEREAFSDAFEPLPAPRIAVLIGGDSRAYKMTETVTRKLAMQLRALALDGRYSVMVTTSRRTGAANQAILDEALLDTPAWVWDGLSDNPYFGFLGWADVILVTADSVSMMSEAGTTGKPVYMIPLEGGHPRITKFHQNMMARGVLRVFDGVVENWTYPPLNDAALIAGEIKKRLEMRISG